MTAHPRGFTLVEVMIVTTIIGILASVAIPEMSKMQYRSKEAERRLIMTAVERAVDDYYAKDLIYPEDLGGGASQIILPTNPPLPPGTTKRPFVPALGDWVSLSLNIEGHVFYCYTGTGTAQPPPAVRTYWTSAVGDLDGDLDWNTANPCTITHLRQWSGTSLLVDTWLDATVLPGPSYGCF